MPSEWDHEALGILSATLTAGQEEGQGATEDDPWWEGVVGDLDEWLNPKEEAPDVVGPVKNELDELMEKERLTVEEIAQAREWIKEEPVEHQGALYEELQKKVEYLNQRNNESAEEVEDGGTCNLTSLAMCLMYLGIANPNPEKQYEDALVDICNEKGWSLLKGATWEKLGKELGALVTYREGGKHNQEWFETTLEGWLQGSGVIVGIPGHVVRIEGVTADGLVVDDPYGACELDGDTGRNWEELNGKEEDGTSEDNVGEDSVWGWDSVTAFDFKYFFTVASA